MQSISNDGLPAENKENSGPRFMPDSVNPDSELFFGDEGPFHLKADEMKNDQDMAN